MPTTRWTFRAASLATAVLCVGSGSYRATSQQALTRFRLDAPVATAAISPEGRVVAASIGRSIQHSDGSWDSSESVEVFDPSASRVVAKIEIPVSQWKDSSLSGEGFISYCDNGDYLVVYDMFSMLYVLDSKTYRVERRINLEHLPTQGALGNRRIACSSQGSILAVNDAGGNYGWGHLVVYDLASGRLLSELRQDPQTRVEFGPIIVAPSGSQLAVLLENPRGKQLQGPDVDIRNARDLKLTGKISADNAPQDISFVGDSELVTVRGTSDLRPSKHFLQLWNVETRKELRRFSDSQFDAEAPVSSSADGREILAALTKYHECHLCNGLEGRIDVKEQRFAVWSARTGRQLFRSDPFGPIIEPLGARCILSQDGKVALIYWPHSETTPKVVTIPLH